MGTLILNDLIDLFIITLIKPIVAHLTQVVKPIKIYILHICGKPIMITLILM